MVQVPHVVVEHMDGGARAFWVSCTTRICVCRRLQSFGEASGLPRLAVACRSVYVRRSCAGNLAALESSSTVSVATLQHGLTSVPSHLHGLCSTCFFCAVSWGLSVAVVVVLMVLSGGARATELSVRCLQHLYCTWWLIVQCPCGIVSAVFQGRAVVTSSFSPGSVLFLRAVWLVGISAQWCGTCYSLWFSALLARWCDCWWMVDGGWAHVVCLFHGSAFWRGFLYCVYW